MEKFMAAIGATVVVIGMLFCASVLNGTTLWLIYDHIHALFPAAYKAGVLPRHLDWWDAVCVTWIFGILIKSTQTNKSKD